MRDRDVRAALHRKVLKEHHGDRNTLVVDELGLRHGCCRVDIAVVNGYLHGYEIKSEFDTLERLPGQIEIYNKVLDRSTLVLSEKHLSKAETMLPEWWGVKVVFRGPRGGIDFSSVRSCRMNPSIDGVALAELLWRSEAVQILQAEGAPQQLLRKPRAYIYSYLAESLDIKALRGLVRQQLKTRAGWRGQRPPS